MKKVYLFLLIGLISFTFSACKKNAADSTGKYYYNATIDGVQYKENIPANNSNSNLEAGSTLGGVDDVVFSANISNNAAGGTSMYISKGIMHNYLSSFAIDFKNFFAAGSYSYAPYGSDGISLGWRDKNGINWSTDAGVADQTGSTFSISGFTEEPTITGPLYIKTTVLFNCKLYDGSGNVKQANGTFVGLFGKI